MRTTPTSGSDATKQLDGVLADGTRWRIRTPRKWNGVLVNDFDYLTRSDEAIFTRLNAEGYATSGTERPVWRRERYDNLAERQNQVAVIEGFRSSVGRPELTIQYGHSGGGLIAEAMAEHTPGLIDGAVVGCAHDNLGLVGQYLDLLFTLRALLVPESELPVARIPSDAAPLAAEWRRVVDVAQETPEGRARIALAVAIAQFPTWGQPGSRKPDPDDVDDVQQAMYATVAHIIGFIVEVRYLFEGYAGGNPVSNVDTDYGAFYRNADPLQQRVVEELHASAGLSLEREIERLGAATRVGADPGATEFYLAPGRTSSARIGTPVLRVHLTGDAHVPPVILGSYDDQIRAHGRQALYRPAVIDRTGHGHAFYTATEVSMLIGAVATRATSGAWEATGPAALNARSTVAGEEPPPFVAYHPPKMSRAVYLDA